MVDKNKSKHTGPQENSGNPSEKATPDGGFVTRPPFRAQNQRKRENLVKSLNHHESQIMKP